MASPPTAWPSLRWPRRCRRSISSPRTCAAADAPARSAVRTRWPRTPTTWSARSTSSGWSARRSWAIRWAAGWSRSAAVRHPERFSGVVIVDGGLGFPLPEGTDLDQLLDALLGPAMAKLRTVYASREEFLKPWRTHPSFQDGGYTPEVEAYLLRDIIGTEPELRSSCILDAVRDDAADELQNPEVIGAIHRLPVPATFLYAERGLLNEPVGLYSPEAGGRGEARRRRSGRALRPRHQPLFDPARRPRDRRGRRGGQGPAVAQRPAPDRKAGCGSEPAPGADALSAPAPGRSTRPAPDPAAGPPAGCRRRGARAWPYSRRPRSSAPRPARCRWPRRRGRSARTRP